MTFQVAVGCGPRAAGAAREATPLVDIFENDDEWIVVADVPGTSPEGVEVNVENSRLHLRAGDYRRTFRVPGKVDSDKVTAEAKLGMVTVHLPKSDAAKPRKVPVAVS